MYEIMEIWYDYWSTDNSPSLVCKSITPRATKASTLSGSNCKFQGVKEYIRWETKITSTYVNHWCRFAWRTRWKACRAFSNWPSL